MPGSIPIPRKIASRVTWLGLAVEDVYLLAFFSLTLYALAKKLPALVAPLLPGGRPGPRFLLGLVPLPLPVALVGALLAYLLLRGAALDRPRDYIWSYLYRLFRPGVYSARAQIAGEAGYFKE